MLWFGKSSNDSNLVSEKMTELSNKVGKDVRQVLTENFPDLVAYFLPTYVAADKNVGRGICSKKRIIRSQQIYKFCDEILTTQKYFSLLNEFIPEILSKILKQVQDPEDLAALLASNEALEQSFIENILPMNQVSFIYSVLNFLHNFSTFSYFHILFHTFLYLFYVLLFFLLF